MPTLNWRRLVGVPRFALPPGIGGGAAPTPALERPSGGVDDPHARLRSLPPEGAQPALGRPGSGLGLHLPRPDIRPGDRWVFVTRTQEEAERGDAGLVMANHVTEIGPNGELHVEVQRINKADSPVLKNIYSNQFDLLSREVVPGEAVQYSPAFPQFEFPMTVGNTWKEQVTQSQPEWELHAQVGVSVTVEAEETVTVPAGTFRTLRLQGHYTASQATVMTHYWYAPAAGRSVKGVEDTLAINGTRTRLIYELQSLNRLRG